MGDRTRWLAPTLLRPSASLTAVGGVLTCVVAGALWLNLSYPTPAFAGETLPKAPAQATAVPRQPPAVPTAIRPVPTVAVRDIKIVQPTAVPTIAPTPTPVDQRPFGVSEETMRIYTALEAARSALSTLAMGIQQFASRASTDLGTFVEGIRSYANFMPPPSIPALPPQIPSELPLPAVSATAAPPNTSAAASTPNTPVAPAATQPTIGQVSVIELGTIESIISPYANILAIVGGLIGLFVFASIARSLTGLLREQRVRNDQSIAIALQSARGELHGKRIDEVFPSISQLIADTSREVIVLQDGVGVVSRAIEPVPQFTVVGADGHEFVFTTDPAWIRKKYGSRAVRKVTSLRTVSVTARARAQAIWERVVSERSSAVAPSSNDWFMVKCAPRA